VSPMWSLSVVYARRRPMLMAVPHRSSRQRVR
jgi:hypothetical protein